MLSDGAAQPGREEQPEAGVDATHDVLDDVDLRATDDIDAKRGTLEPLDEAALLAARPKTVEIPASHVFAKDKICKYCARWSLSALCFVDCACVVLYVGRLNTRWLFSQMSRSRRWTGGRGQWASATRSSRHLEMA
jgi:hypothetical protein